MSATTPAAAANRHFYDTTSTASKRCELQYDIDYITRRIATSDLGSDVYKKWMYVRDNYTRSEGKHGAGSSGEAVKKTSDVRPFLDSLPLSQKYNIVNNVVGEKVKLDENKIMEKAWNEENIIQAYENENMTSISNCNEDSNNIDCDEEDCYKKNIMIDKKKEKLSYFEKRLLLLREKAQQKETAGQKELDETDLFFNSIAKIVKKLPRYEQVQLRMQISSLVGNAELSNISNESMNLSKSNSYKYFSRSCASPVTQEASNVQRQIYYVSKQNSPNEFCYNSESLSRPTIKGDIFDSVSTTDESHSYSYF